MNCPNCEHRLKTLSHDNQYILHCGNCGASFFEENGINRITLSTARKLAEDKKTSVIVGKQKHCPKDKTILSQIYNEESVPASITLFKCPECQGIFAYPEDLVKFKEAQKAKLAYFKFWGNPLPSLRAVLLFSFILLVAVSMVTISSNQQLRTSQSQASEIVGHTSFIYADKSLVIFFRTTIPEMSWITITDKTATIQNTYAISTSFSTNHRLTIRNVPTEDDLYYQLTLKDVQGKVIKTAPQKVVIE